MSSFFAFLKRMRFINRWSLMRNTETENIQEHSLEVAMVAHNLAALKNEYFGGNLDVNKVAVIAMYHEVSEIFTGDMPTPIKYFDPKLRSLYGEVETLAQEMDEEITRLQTELISEREYEKLQNQIEANFVAQNSHMEGIALSLADNYTFYKDTTEEHEELSKEDIENIKAANSWLDSNRRIIAEFLSENLYKKAENHSQLLSYFLLGTFKASLVGI